MQRIGVFAGCDDQGWSWELHPTHFTMLKRNLSRNEINATGAIVTVDYAEFLRRKGIKAYKLPGSNETFLEYNESNPIPVFQPLYTDTQKSGSTRATISVATGLTSSFKNYDDVGFDDMTTYEQRWNPNLTMGSPGTAPPPGVPSDPNTTQPSPFIGSSPSPIIYVLPPPGCENQTRYWTPAPNWDYRIEDYSLVPPGFEFVGPSQLPVEHGMEHFRYSLPQHNKLSETPSHVDVSFSNDATSSSSNSLKALDVVVERFLEGNPSLPKPIKRPEHVESFDPTRLAGDIRKAIYQPIEKRHPSNRKPLGQQKVFARHAPAMETDSNESILEPTPSDSLVPTPSIRTPLDSQRQSIVSEVKKDSEAGSGQMQKSLSVEEDVKYVHDLDTIEEEDSLKSTQESFEEEGLQFTIFSRKDKDSVVEASNQDIQTALELVSCTSLYSLADQCYDDEKSLGQKRREQQARDSDVVASLSRAESVKQHLLTNEENDFGPALKLYSQFYRPHRARYFALPGSGFGILKGLQKSIVIALNLGGAVFSLKGFFKEDAHVCEFLKWQYKDAMWKKDRQLALLFSTFLDNIEDEIVQQDATWLYSVQNTAAFSLSCQVLYRFILHFPKNPPTEGLDGPDPINAFSFSTYNIQSIDVNFLGHYMTRALIVRGQGSITPDQRTLIKSRLELLSLEEYCKGNVNAFWTRTKSNNFLEAWATYFTKPCPLAAIRLKLLMRLESNIIDYDVSILSAIEEVQKDKSLMAEVILHYIRNVFGVEFPGLKSLKKTPQVKKFEKPAVWVDPSLMEPSTSGATDTPLLDKTKPNPTGSTLAEKKKKGQGQGHK